MWFCIGSSHSGHTRGRIRTAPHFFELTPQVWSAPELHWSTAQSAVDDSFESGSGDMIMTVNSVISTSSDETLPARNADIFPGRPGWTLVPSSPDLVPSRRAVSKSLASVPCRGVFVFSRSSPRFLSSRRLLRLAFASRGRGRASRAHAPSPGQLVRRNPPFGPLRSGQRRGGTRPRRRAFTPPLGPAKGCAGPVAAGRSLALFCAPSPPHLVRRKTPSSPLRVPQHRGHPGKVNLCFLRTS